MADVKIALLPTGMTFSRNTKAPLEDNRIFDTLALAQAYVDNVDQTAHAGLTISVVADEIAANNGLYYVEHVADARHTTGLLVKVGSDSASDIADVKVDVETLKTSKADVFTVGNGLSYADNKLGVVVSTTEGNSLSITENGLYVAVPEVKVPEYDLTAVDSPADGYASQYQFKKDGVVLNTINIPKDQFLKDASYDDKNNKLIFVFDTISGEKTQEVDVNDLVDTYNAGDYISITDATISVDYEALKAKINTDLLAPVVTTISGVTARVETLETAKTDHDTRIAALEGVTHPTLDQVTTLENNYSNLNTTVSGLQKDLKVKDVDTTASHGVALKLDGAGKVGVTVDIDTIADAVIEKHIVSFDAESIKTTNAVGSNEAGASVQTVLENLDSRIKAAVSGGVASVAAGNGISVDASDVNNPTVSVNIVSGSALRASADGLDLVWEELA